MSQSAGAGSTNERNNAKNAERAWREVESVTEGHRGW